VDCAATPLVVSSLVYPNPYRPLPDDTEAAFCMNLPIPVKNPRIDGYSDMPQGKL